MAEVKRGPGRPKKGRPPREDFYAGKVMGDLTIIQAVRTPPRAPGGQRYLLRCVCGTRITKPRFYLVRKPNPLTHCGCKTVKADDPYTKRSWYMMHVRCYSPKHIAYKDYGGRGIEVCWDWHKDNPQGWENFKRDMGSRPQGMSLDRIDPDGHYEKLHRVTGELQCRWATPTEQNNNQRRHKKAAPEEEEVADVHE